MADYRWSEEEAVMKKSIFIWFALCASVLYAEVQDRPGGIKIGQRMTLRPYVALD